MKVLKFILANRQPFSYNNLKQDCIQKYNNNGGVFMRDVVKGNQFEVTFCKRCGDEKKVNKFTLCKTCESEVDYEYAIMYETKSKE